MQVKRYVSWSRWFNNIGVVWAKILEVEVFYTGVYEFDKFML